MMHPVIRSERLVLRAWRRSDLAPFAEINADPEVMACFPAPLSREESDALATRIRRHFDEHGFGLWAVEVPGTVSFAGFVGLAVPRFEAAFTPCVEVAWRLARGCWGQGFATEGARAALGHAFGALHLDEVVSFTVPANVRSLRVMQRIGMRHDAGGDFQHPLLPEGHPLRRHVLFRITRHDWARANPPTDP